MEFSARLFFQKWLWREELSTWRFRVNLRILAVIQLRNGTIAKVFGRTSAKLVSAGNNQLSQLQDRLRRLVFRARSKQFPRVTHRRCASTFSPREDASHKAVASKARDYRSRFP